MASKKKSSRRSQAAKRGWITRRAKALARHAAAVRGWETRRAKAAQRQQRKEVERGLLPVGAELELTATTRGGTPRRDKRGGRRTDPAVLALKVYGVVRTPMTFEQAVQVLRRAVQTDVWDLRRLSVEVIDWMKGRRQGQYTTPRDVEDALLVFRDALKTATIRVALVDRWKDLPL